MQQTNTVILQKRRSVRPVAARMLRCFLVGGTQTNATVIGSVLNRYEGVLAAQTGHVSCRHEAERSAYRT